ncbi:hypothetical protein [Shinella sumterensis]|uniref:Uncharacterized protein n=1 Tax=Shinella sumterensis TaxID=1967501 RepID=A0AA50HJD6_9HYPH|nr:hypothetical protein [Shinella sumterensis]WLS01003.1 hypothetical protein Q9313_26775 [Shinella sumterensis]WLS11783.1 hypothetical protein Q9314_27510 [Shinella sumterensis]
MGIKRLTDHWSWGLVSSSAVLLIFFGFVVLHDLFNTQPIGGTIRESGIKVDPFDLFFSCAAAVVLVANIVWDYRHRNDHDV